MARWLLVSILLSVLLTAALNAGLRGLTGTETGRRAARRASRLLADRAEQADRRPGGGLDRTDGRGRSSVRVTVSWKAMLLLSLVATVLLNVVFRVL